MRNNTLFLLWQLTKKDIATRYKGSVLGILWSFIMPLIMLAIYTIVFSEIFQVKWGTQTDDRFSFALILFAGLNIVNMMTEVVNRSTTLIAAHTNYVKKVIFPLRILPLVPVFTALFHCLISYAILIAGNLILTHKISATLWLLPLALLPLLLLSAGFSFIFSGVSVYLRDMMNLVSILSILLMYTSPVFFPLEALPPQFALVCRANPLTYIMENTRNVTLYGVGFIWPQWLISMLGGILVLLAGKWMFCKLQEGFADVL
jgi:lipopolysaccharide transport system permease protein